MTQNSKNYLYEVGSEWLYTEFVSKISYIFTITEISKVDIDFDYILINNAYKIKSRTTWDKNTWERNINNGKLVPLKLKELDMIEDPEFKELFI